MKRSEQEKLGDVLTLNDKQDCGCADASISSRENIMAASKAEGHSSIKQLHRKSYNADKFIASCDAMLMIQGQELPIHSNIISCTCRLPVQRSA